MLICCDVFASREKAFAGHRRSLTGEDVEGNSSECWVDEVSILKIQKVNQNCREMTLIYAPANT